MASYRNYEDYVEDQTGVTQAKLGHLMNERELQEWARKTIPPRADEPITYKGFRLLYCHLDKVKALIARCDEAPDPAYSLACQQALWNASNWAPLGNCREWDGDSATHILPIDAHGNDRGELSWS